MSNIENFLKSYLFGLSLPSIRITDLVEIFIIAFVVYEIMLWVKNNERLLNFYKKNNFFIADDFVVMFRN